MLAVAGLKPSVMSGTGVVLSGSGHLLLSHASSEIDVDLSPAWEWLSEIGVDLSPLWQWPLTVEPCVV